jgi:tRNA(Ile)-lysidine synthetase-like protein
MWLEISLLIIVSSFGLITIFHEKNKLTPFEKIYKKYKYLMDTNVTINMRNNLTLDFLRKSPLFQDLIIYFETHVPKDTPYIGVSLSGGVDSMVLMTMLTHIPKHTKLGYNFTVVAFHINYNNRKEAPKEADFLEKYCEIIGVIFHRVDMTFVRDSTDRTEYEIASKKLRFANYKKIINDYKMKCGIFIGHHSDDVGENVFTNIANKRSLLQLSGMTRYSIIDGVPLMRPMLGRPKNDVFNLAHSMSIPYFKDTTPKWSRRGKMRNEIFPIIVNQYPNFLNSLYNLGIESDGFKNDLQILAIDNIKNNSCGGNYGIYLDCRGFSQKLSCGFWKQVLEQLMHENHHTMLSHSIIDNFYRYIQIPNNLYIFSGGKERMCYLFNQQLLILMSRQTPIDTFELVDYTLGRKIDISPKWVCMISPVIAPEISPKEVINKIVTENIFIFHANIDLTKPINFSSNREINDPIIPRILTRHIVTPHQSLKKDPHRILSPVIIELKPKED